MIGGVVNGTSPGSSVEEMTHALKTARTKYIITVPASIQIVVEAASAAGISLEHVFLFDGDFGGYTSINDLLAIGEEYGESGQQPFFRVPQGQTNDICGYLNFSSGTTGLPKAVRPSLPTTSTQLTHS